MALNLRTSVDALVAELKRLRSEGVESVYLEGQTLAALKEHAKSLEASSFADLVARELGGAQGQGAADGDRIATGSNRAGGSADARGASGATQKAGRPKRSEFSDGSEDFMATVSEAGVVGGNGQGAAAIEAASGHAAKVSAQGLPAGVSPIPEPQPFELPKGDKQTQWDWLLNKVQTDPVCLEHLKPGKKLVLGTGSLDADIFFCGEAPGQEEEQQGEPFVGPAGQLLDKIIQAMGVQRSEVYIGNIMNWRPEHDKPYGNRAPVEAEIRYCLPYLLAQLQIVRPKVVVALGLTAANGLLGYDPDRRLGAVRGRWLTVGDYPLMITYHPSYLLHNNALNARRMVWEDFMLVMEKVGMPISRKQRLFFTKS